MNDVGERATAMFADRLNLLFAACYPPGRGPYIPAEVVAGIFPTRHRISAPYLSQLRHGYRTAPSKATMSAIAGFFQIPVEYFTDDECFARIRDELEYRALYLPPAPSTPPAENNSAA